MQDRYVKYHALESIAVCAIEDKLNEYKYVFLSIGDEDEVVRSLAMRLSTKASGAQINAVLPVFCNEKNESGLILCYGIKSLKNFSIQSDREIISELISHEPLKENSNMLCYKINGKKYGTDYSTVFLSDSDTIFSNSSGEAVYFMIYNKRYLVVGYFPENNPQSPLAYELRAVNRIDIIEINKWQNKWTYRFDPVISLANVKSFSPFDGTLIHVKIIRALPVSE